MAPSQNSTRVLIVEDEKHLAEGLRFNLELEGYSVEVAESGEAGLERLAAERYDLVLLDVMLPGKDGFTVARELRDNGQFVPILILTARGRAEDVMAGFAAGADDYLPKPFELGVLLARANALLRRTQWARAAQSESPRPEPESFTFAGKTIDFARRELRGGGKSFPLTLMESNLLRFLVRNKGRSISRKSLLEGVWEVREDTDTRAIDNFIVRLRRYLETDPQRPRHLLTVRGLGYRFEPEPKEEREP